MDYDIIGLAAKKNLHFLCLRNSFNNSQISTITPPPEGKEWLLKAHLEMPITLPLILEYFVALF